MSIVKHTSQRVAVLIDTQNLYHSAKHLFGRRVNFGNVVTDAVAGRDLVRAIAYVITSEAGDEKNFFEALVKMGIETKTKDLQVFQDGAKKGDWDVGLAVDAISLSTKVDTIILVTGDGDFVPLVQYLKTHGVQVEVVSFTRSTSKLLADATDETFDLGANPSRYLIGTQNRMPQRTAQTSETRPVATEQKQPTRTNQRTAQKTAKRTRR